MKTLIELYDERPLENVLAPEVFKPETVVYLCPAEVAQNPLLQQKLTAYLRHRGLSCNTVFLESSLFRADKLCRQMQTVLEQYEDCAIDVTGGSDAALFAAGLVCARTGTPAFTYSRRQHRFYDIHHAAFAHELPCRVRYGVDDCFLMAGGSARPGRVDNTVLHEYLGYIDAFFGVFMKYRTRWKSLVSYMVAASQAPRGTEPSCNVSAERTLKAARNSYVTVDDALLLALEEIGLLHSVTLSPNHVEFSFRDLQIRTWLRDVGSVLELYVWKSCMDLGIFQEVRTSVIVDWEGARSHDSVCNEIDVVAVQGIMPVFISCKACDIDTDALNELAILRDRFGGAVSRALIVSTEHCQAVTRHRAWELGIEVIDLGSIRNVRSRLQTLLG